LAANQRWVIPILLLLITNHRELACCVSVVFFGQCRVIETDQWSKAKQPFNDTISGK
jgi:hypothetical protein